MPRVVDFAQELNKLLDVETPWTFMLHDRTGLSEIRPDEDVETQLGGQAEEDPEEQVQPLAFLVCPLLLMDARFIADCCHASNLITFLYTQREREEAARLGAIYDKLLSCVCVCVCPRRVPDE